MRILIDESILCYDNYMKKFVIGKPFETEFGFRETCFGICEREGKLLLTQKGNEISLVGGGMEDTETPEVCLKREFAEEVGYAISAIRELCDVDCYWLAAGSYPMRSLAHFYLVEVEESLFDPTEEGHQAIWIDKEHVKDLCPLPYHRKAIEYYLEKKPRD